MTDTAINYQQLLTDTLQRQMVILGPTITLAKVKHVNGLSVADDGRVTSINGNPQEVSIKLLEEFRELSPLMVKKTMKPLLSAIITSYAKPVDAQPSQEHTPEVAHEPMNGAQNQPQNQNKPNPNPEAKPDPNAAVH